MKALITGPRQSFTSKDENGKTVLPHLSIEVDLEELPKQGETIIINGGSSYTVERVMWWVDGPETESYYSQSSDYEVEGQYQVAHIDVLPSGWILADDAVKRGRDQAVAELRARLAATIKAFGDDSAKVVVTLTSWLAEQEA